MRNVFNSPPDIFKLDEQIDYKRFWFGKINLWNVSRKYLYNTLEKSEYCLIDKPKRYKYILPLIGSMYNLLLVLLRRRKYLLILETLEETRTGELKLVHEIVQQLGYKNLVIVLSDTSQYERTYHGIPIISSSLFGLASKVICKIRHPRVRSQAKDINTYLKQFDIRFQLPKYYYSDLLAKFSVYKCFFRLYRFNVVLTTNFEQPTNNIMVQSANKYKIKTIEIQHGVVAKKTHPYTFKYAEKSFYTTDTFVFGDYNKENILHWQSKVHVIGHYTIDYQNKYFNIESIPKYAKFKQNYDKIIVVTLQETCLNLVDFMNDVARQAPNWLIVILPRKTSDFNIVINENLIIENSYTFYDIIKYADFHVTAYSNCAYEAVSMGVPTIFTDIHFYSKTIFDDFEANVAALVDSPKDFISCVDKNNFISSEDMIKTNMFYKPNHVDNIRKAFKEILN